MAWDLTGQLIEACSCKSACPCTLGAAEPDRGWCSGALTFTIQQGQSDGVNLGGRTVVWLIDLPKDFLSGNGTVRIYVDDGADAGQMRELEAPSRAGPSRSSTEVAHAPGTRRWTRLHPPHPSSSALPTKRRAPVSREMTMITELQLIGGSFGNWR